MAVNAKFDPNTSAKKQYGTGESVNPYGVTYVPVESSPRPTAGGANYSNVIQQVGADGSKTGVKTENSVPVIAPTTGPEMTFPTAQQIQQATQGAQHMGADYDRLIQQANDAGGTPDDGYNQPPNTLPGDTGGGNVQPPVTLPDGAGGNQQPPVNLPGSHAAPTTPVTPSVPTTLPSANDLTASLKGTMSDWRDAANKQQQAKIDYAVQQAVAELQRAEQDAQGQFKEQAESVALDERQGMDNAALYAEARGDKGGIGLAQYNEIQAAAAQNRLSVQQAQTKLSTDTARQIADLRAKGEFDKADALLEVSQTYLTQLMQLEQWAANYGLDVEKFRQSLDQWQHEYDLALEKFGYQKTQDSKQSATEFGMAMLNAGMPLDEATRQAMGLSKAQADAMYAAALMGATQTSNGGYKTNAELFAAVKAAGGTDEDSARAALRVLGVEDPDDFIDAYMAWYDGQGGDASMVAGGGLYAETYAALDGYKAQGYTNGQMWLVIDSLPISDEEKEILVKHYGVE